MPEGRSVNRIHKMHELHSFVTYPPAHVSDKSLTVAGGILSLRHGVARHINIQQTVHCLFVCLFFVTIAIVSETYEFLDPSYSKRA